MLRGTMVLFLAFVVIPIAEIALLIHVGGLIGAWQTVGLVILTAAIGTLLFRAQGFRVLMRAQDVLAQGDFPAKELFDGICILVAGVLLLTPGFITDGLGLLLLVPGTRLWIGRALWRAAMRSRHFEMRVQTGFGAEPYEAEDEGVIEGEFKEVRPDRPPPPRVRSAKPEADEPRS
ncbi:MAG: FxsA family protein [Alphaproteobacteria bacterium]|nr:FxsA family protein [Alphaproteobacteria bacterium]